MLHIKFTIMILFLNIALTAFMPGLILGETDNYLFQTDNNGDYTINDEFSDSLGATVNGNEGGLPKTSTFGITDLITLLWETIKLLFAIFFASFTVLLYLYEVGNIFALVLGVPLIISYGLAIVGWVK